MVVEVCLDADGTLRVVRSVTVVVEGRVWAEQKEEGDREKEGASRFGRHGDLAEMNVPDEDENVAGAGRGCIFIAVRGG